MKRTRKLRGVGLIAGLMALLMVLAACGSDSDDSGGSSGSGDEGGSEGGTVTLGIIPSWTDGLSMAYLWKNILEDKGYTVEIEEIPDAAPLYTGLAKGDVDVYPSAWPEVTHASYMEKNGDDLDDLGAYYENAKLTLAVPDYMDITSIEDLPDIADDLDGKIIGIEAGAGLTKAVKESVIPDYGLDGDFTLVESSTTAMLAELGKAVKNEDDIVVTLWRPFWANSEFPVKDLEDPKGALGEAETLNAVANAEFSDEFPEVAEMMGKLKLDDDQYGSLEKAVVDSDGNEEDAVATWVEENQDVIDSLE